MYCHLILKCCVVLSFLLTKSVTSEQYLFREGTITYKSKLHSGKSNLNAKNVKHIDSHLIKEGVHIKVVSRIPHLYEGAVKNLDQLMKLSLPNCKIASISPGAFQNLPNLQELHLQDNLVETIEEGVFNYLPVKNLFLQRNSISIIKSGAFDNMPNLYKIHLNNNTLTMWDSNWFRNTPHLSLIHFRRNYLTELPPRAFANIGSAHRRDEIPNLVIYLSKNKISKIHPQAFQGVDALGELWLDRNKLERIDRSIFSQLAEISTLDLKKNRIEEVDKNAFKNLNSISKLDLSFNRLTCIDFDVVSMVYNINIENNGISCTCLSDLREKLNENRRRIKVKFIGNPSCIPD